MKNRILGVLILLAGSVPHAIAQDTASASFLQRVTWGARLFYGTTFNRSDPDELLEFNGPASRGGGIFALWGAQGFLDPGVQAELMYVAEDVGGIDEMGSYDSYYTNRVRLPVVGKISLGVPSHLQPSFYFGGYVQYVISSVNTDTWSEGASLAPFGYGVIAGMDLRLLKSLVLDLRITFGSNSEFTGAASDSDPVTSFTFGVGYVLWN